MQISHDARAGRFWTQAGDGLGAELDYRLDGGLVIFTHTGVAPALRGRGIAAALVEAGLQWAQQQGLRVVPACSYVEAYMRRHPQWLALKA